MFLITFISVSAKHILSIIAPDLYHETAETLYCKSHGIERYEK